MITLYVDGSSIGTGNTGDSDWKTLNGAYMLPDTQNIAGKGSSTFAANYDNVLANDNVAGTGFTTLPPSTWPGPPGP